MKKDVKRKLIVIGCLILTIILLSILKSIPKCADFYASHIFYPYASYVGGFTSLIPLSIFEHLFVLLIVFFIFLLIRILKGIKCGKCLTRSLSFLLVIIGTATLYLGTAGVCYGRSEFSFHELSNEEINSTLVEEALKYYIDEYNSLAQLVERDENGLPKLPYSTEELSSIINEEYRKLNQLDGYASNFSPTVKELLSSRLFLEMQITGISMGITGEANIDKFTPSSELPFTIAHEIAHIKGIYREADANQAALIVLMNSDNIYLRYSSLYVSISSLMEAYNLTFRDDYSKKYPLCNEIKIEWNYNYNYWKKHDLLGTITDKWNTFYLKLNGSKKGTEDYIDTTEKVDTGEKDDNGNTIFEITSYSPYQRYLYYLYLSK